VGTAAGRHAPDPASDGVVQMGHWQERLMLVVS
jgi:hypothetical protein